MLDQQYEFLGQNQEEEVVLVVKPHWLFFSIPLVKILAVGAILLTTLHFFGASTLTSYAFFIALGLILYISSINGFRWVNTVYLLTSHRIICVYQTGLFNRMVAESTLENILFISHKISGALSTLLNVGSIHIRASGVTEEEIILEGIFDPYNVQQQITSAQKKYADRGEESKSANSSTESFKSFWQAGKKKQIIR